MHIELESLIANAVAALPWDRYPAAMRDERIDRLKRSVEVSDCPPELEWDLTSSIAFKVAAELGRDASPEAKEALTPLAIAADILAAVSRAASPAAPLFRFEISRLGHINAACTEALLRALLERPFSEGASVLLQHSPFVASADARRPFEPVRIDTDALLERSAKLKNADITLLRRERARFDAPELLMLLALMADPELEAEPFLSGHGGRQNVPEYLRRFSRDWRRFLASEAAVASGFAAPGASGAAACFAARTAIADRRCRALRWEAAQSIGAQTDLVLRYRQAVLTLLRGRPELLLSHLLEMVKTFYRFFNHPGCRSLSAPGVEPRAWIALLNLTRLSGELVERGLDLLEFPCGIASSVLEIGTKDL